MTKIRANRPSHRRVADVPKMQPTPRDKAILTTTYHFRVLTGHQIEVLHFASRAAETRSRRSACQRRLQLLYHHGFLERVPRAVVMGEGRKSFAYALATRGADEVANLLGLDRAQIGWKPKDNKLGPLFLEHLLAVNDLRVVMNLLVTHQVWAEVRWIAESALRAEPYVDKLPFFVKRSRRISIIPDAYLQVRPQADGRLMHFFVEVDRGSESNRQWVDKMKAYQMFRHSGLSRQHFGTSNFRILALVSSQRRLENLVKATESVAADGYSWFALHADADIWHPQRLLDPIWHVCGAQERQSFFPPTPS